MDQTATLQPGPTAQRPARVMLYSHDTFGLGHLRRSSALAAAITRAHPDASALILTGSPVAGRFAFPERVDHVRLPGVIKRRDGSYDSQTMGLHIDETTELRGGIICAAASHFDPDLLIVDKEPSGFRGELLPTLDMLKTRGKTSLVLGLRDVLDDPQVLAAEWARKDAVRTTERFYDEIWVYGMQSIYDPTAGLPLSAEVRNRLHWTGYLRRSSPTTPEPSGAPYILVTPGGGGDGHAMVDMVLSAYEQDPDLGPQAKIVYGPFLSGEARQDFETRVERLNGRVSAVGFDAQIEGLFLGAEGVICMGGYNTFCEVLSFDKRAVIVPRTVPRLEQHIRAARAEALGLIRMIDETRDTMTPETMIRAIRNLLDQPLPSEAMPEGLLDGLDYVAGRVSHRMARGRAAATQAQAQIAE